MYTHSNPYIFAGVEWYQNLVKYRKKGVSKKPQLVENAQEMGI